MVVMEVDADSSNIAVIHTSHPHAYIYGNLVIDVVVITKGE